MPSLLRLIAVLSLLALVASAQEFRPGALNDKGEFRIPPHQAKACQGCSGKGVYDCQTCDGGKKARPGKCLECNGKKKAPCARCGGGAGGKTYDPFESCICPRCEGKGWARCDQCEDKGAITLNGPGKGPTCKLCKGQGGMKCDLCEGKRLLKFAGIDGKPMTEALYPALQARFDKLKVLIEDVSQFAEPTSQRSVEKFLAIMERCEKLMPFIPKTMAANTKARCDLLMKEKQVPNGSEYTAHARQNCLVAIANLAVAEQKAVVKCMDVRNESAQRRAESQPAGEADKKN